MLSKFENRYDETKSETDFRRWSSFAFSAFTAPNIGKSFPEAVALKLLNGLKQQYMAERNEATLDIWMRCARQCEASYSTEPFMRHLEEALTERHAHEHADHKILEELAGLYEKWENQLPVSPSSRYSLAFPEWLEATSEGDHTGHFSVGSSAGGPLQLQVRYPFGLIAAMLEGGSKLRILLCDLPEAYVCIGLDILPSELRPVCAEHRTIFQGAKPLYLG